MEFKSGVNALEVACECCRLGTLIVMGHWEMTIQVIFSDACLSTI